MWPIEITLRRRNENPRISSNIEVIFVTSSQVGIRVVLWSNSWRRQGGREERSSVGLFDWNYFLNRRETSTIIMVDRANIKQMIPALPDEKIGNYSRRVKKICLFDSAPPSNAICFYCLFNNCIVLIANTGLYKSYFIVSCLTLNILNVDLCVILQICWQLRVYSSSKLLILGINELIGNRIYSK